ncbi:alpha/beta fold hydrolase [Halomonas sp. DWK9]|uniref:alpha/beta fold hydrolase n=1 Tax=Halomonadaceae TaxID=28256 RepID=UPI00287F6DB3|nr:alpha/beta fold hydrolase [Halomonas sp. DWK9]
MSYYADQGFERIAPEALVGRLAGPAIQRFIIDGHGPVSVSGRPEIGRIVLAHGAGAGHLSAFMRQFAAILSSQGLQVWAMDFPYMQQMSEQGTRRPPPSVKTNVAHFTAWYDLIAPLINSPLWVGGKSMGGRVASMFASERRCGGVVAVGYPFHPPKKPESLRTEHLENVVDPMLIIQGERDPFGTQADVAGYRLPSTLAIKWLTDGDHDFKPRRASGINQQVLIDEAAIVAASFVRAHQADAAGTFSTLV